MNAQNFIDIYNLGAKASRADYHLTLGGLIDKLDFASPNLPVTSDYGPPGEGLSYRGYYCDLAFEKEGEAITVKDFLNRCKRLLDQEQEGYKGGQFLMERDTPLWISDYETDSNIAIVETETKETLGSDKGLFYLETRIIK